jgi:hypothetical protein
MRTFTRLIVLAASATLALSVVAASSPTAAAAATAATVSGAQPQLYGPLSPTPDQRDQALDYTVTVTISSVDEQSSPKHRERRPLLRSRRLPGEDYGFDMQSAEEGALGLFLLLLIATLLCCCCLCNLCRPRPAPHYGGYPPYGAAPYGGYGGGGYGRGSCCPSLCDCLAIICLWEICCDPNCPDPNICPNICPGNDFSMM